MIAATLAMTALDQWGCPTVRADGPTDIVTHWNPDDPNQFFWVDDAFGSVRHEEALTEDWARRLPKVMAAVKGGARVVLTSRDYIYRGARPLLKEYAYPLLQEQKVVINVAELSRKERQQIVYNHIRLGDQPRHIRTALKPYLTHIADEQPFRPEVVRRLGRQAFTHGLAISAQSVHRFMTRPNSFLQDIYQGLEPDYIGALALVYQSGDLSVPFEVSSSERKDLLAAVGSSPNRIGSALTVLEGTFLRRAPKPGASDYQEYWFFRHPTLREGFAAFIANQPNLLRLLIDGLDEMGILTQLDCGSGETQGTLVRVPTSLYPIVAERVARARPSQRWGEDWFIWHTWANFFSTRCSRQFLETYLTVDPDLINRSLSFGSYLSAMPELGILAKLHAMGLLTEEQYASAVSNVSDLAVETPDADWLDDRALSILLSDQEHDAILARVRRELIPDLDDMLWNWYFNEQGESAEEYYGPLIEALQNYKGVFEAQGDVEAVRLLEAALLKANERQTEAAHWQTDDEDQPAASRETIYSTDESWRSRSSSQEIGERSVFDDVDE